MIVPFLIACVILLVLHRLSTLNIVDDDPAPGTVGGHVYEDEEGL